MADSIQQAAADSSKPDDKRRQPPRMTADEVIAALSCIKQGVSPTAALEAALELKEELTPRLLEELALAPVEVQTRCDRADADGSTYWLHTMAMYLMAAYEEQRAWPLILDFLASDSDLASGLTGLDLDDELPAILCRCYDGNLAPLERIIEEHAFDPLARYACLKAYHALALAGKAPRDRLIAFLAQLLDVPLGAVPSDWYGWLALAACEVREPALRHRIEALFDRTLTKDGSHSISIIGRDEIERIYSDDRTDIERGLLQDDLFDDLPAEIGARWWFQPVVPTQLLDAATRAWIDHRLDRPIVRARPKVGRNEPCPCGSDKKYKKCCLDEQRDLLM